MNENINILIHENKSNDAVVLQVDIAPENHRKRIPPIVFNSEDARQHLTEIYGNRLGRLINGCTLENRPHIANLSGRFVFELMSTRPFLRKSAPATRKTPTKRRSTKKASKTTE